jgi:sialate O-acetylesterase
LVARAGTLKWFEIAGADGKFVAAEAKIDGASVMVSSPEVAAPVAVRYAWVNFPDGGHLYNSAGLPAAQFRSDAPKLSVE